MPGAAAVQPDYLVSVHDVMPETLTPVRRVIDALERAGLGPATLLVVPGRDWRDADIGALRAFVSAGHDLAGHGWKHEIDRVRGLRHWLHAVTISRNVAEHLQYDARDIAALIQRCRAWFEDHSLPAPSLYVPPAWAMGSISKSDLDGLGFRWFETLAGIYDAERREMHRLPLLGFEADTRFRALSLRAFNAANRALARYRGTVRLGIHPHDFDLELARDLERCLAEGRRTTSVEALA